MDLSTLVTQPIAILALAMTLIVAYRLLSPASGTNVPWAKTSIPFLGGAIGYGKQPVNFLVEQRQKVGDVFRINLLVMKMTFVIGSKWNQWLLKNTKEEDVSFWNAMLALNCGLLDTSFHYPGWVDRGTKALINGMNRPARLEKYSEEIAHVAASLFDSWSTEPRVPLFISSSDLLLQASMTTLYGPAFVKRHATELIPIVRAFERAFVHPLTRVLPLWMSPSGRVLLRAYRRMKEVIEAEVRMRLKDLERWRGEGDYMSYLLTMDDKAEDFFACYGEHLMIMISASHVNTAGTFSWTLLHLLRNPDLLAQFEDEIRHNPPTNGIYPAKNMPFSEACMRESGRLYTNLLLVRYATHDLMTPDGMVIPKGWIAASPLATQQDPELYPHPDEWDPHRFLVSAGPGDYSSKFRNNEFVQFGYGKHACLGEKLTHTLLRSNLWPTLFDGYQVEIVDGVIEGEGIGGVGVKPNFRENLGTPFGDREVWVRVRKRAVKLTEVE